MSSATSRTRGDTEHQTERFLDGGISPRACFEVCAGAMGEPNALEFPAPQRVLRTQGILVEDMASHVVDISGDPDRLVAMVAGRSVTLIATTKRLGMYVGGEVIIGARLLLRLGAARARAVVVAGYVDAAIRAALTSIGGVEVLPDA